METALEKLDKKITQMSQNYLNLKEQNKILLKELATVKAQNENQRIKIEQLEEELMKKEIEAEEIVKKVEEILGQ